MFTHRLEIPATGVPQQNIMEVGPMEGEPGGVQRLGAGKTLQTGRRTGLLMPMQSMVQRAGVPGPGPTQQVSKLSGIQYRMRASRMPHLLEQNPAFRSDRRVLGLQGM
jgi:hypothetical protein